MEKPNYQPFRHSWTSSVVRLRLSFHWSLTLLPILTELVFSPRGSDMWSAYCQRHRKNTEQQTSCFSAGGTRAHGILQISSECSCNLRKCVVSHRCAGKGLQNTDLAPGAIHQTVGAVRDLRELVPVCSALLLGREVNIFILQFLDFLICKMTCSFCCACRVDDAGPSPEIQGCKSLSSVWPQPIPWGGPKRNIPIGVQGRLSTLCISRDFLAQTPIV